MRTIVKADAGYFLVGLLDGGKLWRASIIAWEIEEIGPEKNRDYIVTPITLEGLFSGGVCIHAIQPPVGPFQTFEGATFASEQELIKEFQKYGVVEVS